MSTAAAGRLILASQSASRRAMLDAAGVSYTAVPAAVDEDAVKQRMAGASASEVATTLAELKAVTVSQQQQQQPGALVLGSDSLVELADGGRLDKPRDRDEAAGHLRRLAGGRHALISAAVLAEHGQPVWRHADTAWLQVRPLSDGFIDDYLEREWPAIAGCVGCFRIEGPGVQLFERVDGDHFTVLGMPLFPVLAELRARGVLAS